MHLVEICAVPLLRVGQVARDAVEGLEPAEVQRRLGAAIGGPLGAGGGARSERLGGDDEEIVSAGPRVEAAHVQRHLRLRGGGRGVGTSVDEGGEIRRVGVQRRQPHEGADDESVRGKRSEEGATLQVISAARDAGDAEVPVRVDRQRLADEAAVPVRIEDGVRRDVLRVQHILGGAVVVLEDGAERAADDTGGGRAVAFGPFALHRGGLGGGLLRVARITQRPAIKLDAGDEDGEGRAKLQKTAHDWCPPDEGEWLAKAIPSEWLAIKPFNEGGQSLSVAFANAETAAAPTTDSAVAFFLRASGILRR